MVGEEYMKLLALDPGGTTGAVLLDWDGSVNPGPNSMIEAWEVPFANYPSWLDHLMYTADLLVIERFIISPRTVQYTRQPDALYVIGGALLLADLRKIPVKMQTAADAKNAYENARLKGDGWKLTGHARDALRHALLATHDRTLFVA